MKFPEEPESTRAETETERSGVNGCTVNKERDVIAGSKFTVLTAGRGSRTGQVPMKCSEEAQYKQRPAARRRARSTGGSLVESNCMGSGIGGMVAGVPDW